MLDELETETETDKGSWVVTVEGAPTLRVEWTCFAPSEDLLLALYDRAVRCLALTAPIPGGLEIVYPPVAATMTSSAPAVVLSSPDPARC